jgi:HEPN domain-containing protein
MQIVTVIPEKHVIVLRWLDWADADYLAARALLLGGYVIQGTSFANTALEKYLKTLFVIFGFKVPKSHDVRYLYCEIIKEVKSLKLNVDFLELLFKAYKIRYPDDLEIGYNVHLSDAMILSELDSSVFEIRKGFNISKNGDSLKTKFNEALRVRKPELVTKNCSFGGFSREQLFKEESSIYEMRILENNNLIEYSYKVENLNDSKDFLYEALKPEVKLN